MSKYRNNKDGTLDPIATNVHLMGGQNNYVTQAELLAGLATKQDKLSITYKYEDTLNNSGYTPISGITDGEDNPVTVIESGLYLVLSEMNISNTTLGYEAHGYFIIAVGSGFSYNPRVETHNFNHSPSVSYAMIDTDTNVADLSQRYEWFDSSGTASYPTNHVKMYLIKLS